MSRTKMHGLILSMLAAMGGVFDSQVISGLPRARSTKGLGAPIDPATLGNKPPSRRDRRRAQAAAAKQTAPGPKFAKARRRRARQTPLRDDLGAYTLVGREPRRKWVAGISAWGGR